MIASVGDFLESMKFQILGQELKSSGSIQTGIFFRGNAPHSTMPGRPKIAGVLSSNRSFRRSQACLAELRLSPVRPGEIASHRVRAISAAAHDFELLISKDCRRWRVPVASFARPANMHQRFRVQTG
jgi:hypothetical protein